MQLTSEHQALRETILKWIHKDINPNIEAWEEQGQYPAHQVIKQMANLGLLGLDKPQAFGGMGLDYSYSAVLAMALGDIHCGGVPMSIGVHTDMATPALAKHGSDSLRKEFLEPAIAGDMLACLGVSEVGGGSDVASITTQARKDGDDYIIDGGKMWTTNGCQADFCVVLANTSAGQVHKNKSLIVVPMNTKGVQVAKKIQKMGMDSSDTAQLYFDSVRVPQRYRIGHEGMGFMYQMEQFQIERLWAGFCAVGSIRSLIQYTIDYTRQREVFGKPILEHQWVHFRLAELKAEIDMLETTCWAAAEKIVHQQDATELATVAKLKAGRLQRVCTDALVQMWGGMGYAEGRISRAYRDGRLSSIGGGADEVMLQILCKFMGIFPKN
ncbi:MAG: acyl-CoA dehydrogenase family protein [Gammaproteobacteria bacterium]|nr:acyl-CoA dehydrogenase family protein [Gammaproteobacteria bacterium]